MPHPSDAETAHVQAYLAEHQAQAAARTIPVYGFDSFARDPAGNLATRKGLLFVAGFGHPPNADAAVWLVREVMPLVWEKAPEVNLYVVGSNPTAQVKALAGRRVTVTGFVTETELSHHYASARVAVAPMRFGAGVKGKVVEALRFGLPVATTTTGAQGLDGARSFLSVADEPSALAGEILNLLANDERWRRCAEEGLAFAKEHFSLAAMERVLGEQLDLPPRA